MCNGKRSILKNKCLVFALILGIFVKPSLADEEKLTPDQQEEKEFILIMQAMFGFQSQVKAGLPDDFNSDNTDVLASLGLVPESQVTADDELRALPGDAGKNCESGNHIAYQSLQFELNGLAKQILGPKKAKTATKIRMEYDDTNHALRMVVPPFLNMCLHNNIAANLTHVDKANEQELIISMITRETGALKTKKDFIECASKKVYDGTTPEDRQAMLAAWKAQDKTSQGWQKGKEVSSTILANFLNSSGKNGIRSIKLPSKIDTTRPVNFFYDGYHGEDKYTDVIKKHFDSDLTPVRDIPGDECRYYYNPTRDRLDPSKELKNVLISATDAFENSVRVKCSSGDLNVIKDLLKQDLEPYGYSSDMIMKAYRHFTNGRLDEMLAKAG